MNPKLEKASWIAGIISAVIAVYAILPATHNPKPTELTQQRETDNYKKPDDRNKEAAASTEIKSFADIKIPAPCQDNPNLSGAIKMAESIYQTDARDKTFISLVHDALCAEKYDLALKTATQIYTTKTRDDCLYSSIEFLILKNDMTTANRFAENIYTTTIRDRAKQAIIVGIKSRQANTRLDPSGNKPGKVLH